MTNSRRGYVNGGVQRHRTEALAAPALAAEPPLPAATGPVGAKAEAADAAAPPHVVGAVSSAAAASSAVAGSSSAAEGFEDAAAMLPASAKLPASLARP
jgi:hypothetical protein